MTKEEFSAVEFGSGMKIKHHSTLTNTDDEYFLAGVDFEEFLIGIINKKGETAINWVRCENCEIINQ